MVQTPQQRRANNRYERAESAKRGKPASAVKSSSLSARGDRAKGAPISRTAIAILLFALCGGAVFQLLRLFF